MVIKIAKRSVRQFQFGEDSEPIIEVDVIEVADQWHEINFQLRVAEGDDWVVPPDKVNEFGVNRLNFVQAIVNAAYGDKTAPTLTRFEAEEFIREVVKETVSLRNFSLPKTAETSSAPESTAKEETFSQ